MLRFGEYNKMLMEMPKIMKSWDPEELIDADKNRENYLELYKEQRKKLAFNLSANSNMYEWRDNFFVLDIEEELITYDMTYKLGSCIELGDFVWQSGVWINPVYNYIEGVAAKMFFEILLKRHHTILTDSIQTFDGKRFWERCIGKAFNKGLNVYYFDFLTKELEKIDNLHEWEMFKKKNKDIWGKTDRHKMKRMLITDKLL
jgi:hypothetical protein